MTTIYSKAGADAAFIRTVNGTGPDGSGDVTVAESSGGASLYAAEREDYATRLRSLKVTSPSYNQIDDFAAATGWSNGTATTIDGSTVLQWTNGTGHPLKDYGAPLGITASQINFYLRFHVADPATFYRLRVYFYDSTGVNGYGALFSAPVGGWDSSGWQTITLKRASFSNVGTAPGWDQVRQAKVTVEVTGGQPQPVVAFDEIAFYAMRPVCSIWFDDGHPTVYSEAFPRMAAHDFTGSLTVQGRLDYYTPHMTAAQHREMAQAGWDLSNHTYTHPDLTTLDEAGQRAEIARGLDVAQKLGPGPANYHLVPPMGRQDDTTMAIASEYASVVRSSSGSNALPILDMFSLKSRDTGPSDPVATITGWIDTAIANQEWLVILFHKLDTSGAAVTYSPANFQAVIDYLDAQRANIDTLPPSMALARM